MLLQNAEEAVSCPITLGASQNLVCARKERGDQKAGVDGGRQRDD
jgi:hypothetical protein